MRKTLMKQNMRFWIIKTNALLNLIKNQPDIDKTYLYVKDPYEAKSQYLINKREKVYLKHYNDTKAFIEYLGDMQDVYKNIEEYNLGKNVKNVFDDLIADMISNEKLNSIVQNCLSEVENSTFNLFLLNNHI